MAFVTNVLILEPIVYCALFVKEDKTGKRVKWVVKGKAVLAINIRSSKRCFTRPSSLTRRSTLVLKVGVSIRWKMAICVASYSQRRLR